MDGIHDLGGMAGFGSIEVEADEPTFHHAWEAKAFRLNLAAIGVLGAYNADEYRHAIERMAPAHYLAASYYERVLTAVATLLVEKGILSIDDLERRAGGRIPLALPVRPNSDDRVVERTEPRFAVGSTVVVREVHRSGHTRVPRYVRGRRGVVLHVAPRFSYPDASAHGLPRRKEPTYHVEFSAAELWPDCEAGGDAIIVDLWESYLDESR